MRVYKVISSICLSAISLAGCAAPLNAPSAYEGERFLCGEEHANEFDALVAECLEANLRGGACEGVASVKVDLTSQHAVVDSPLTSANYGPDPRDPVMRAMGVRGVSPYFAYHVNMGITTASLTAGNVTSEADEICVRPPIGSSAVGIEVRGSSDTLAFRLTSCTVNARDGLRITFSGDIVRGGTMNACAYIVPRDVVR